jgi:hypothetical protein
MIFIRNRIGSLRRACMRTVQLPRKICVVGYDVHTNGGSSWDDEDGSHGPIAGYTSRYNSDNSVNTGRIVCVCPLFDTKLWISSVLQGGLATKSLAMK